MSLTSSPAPPRRGPAADAAGRRTRLLVPASALLGTAVAVTSMLGPLVLDLMRYRTSATTLNQLLGSDAVALCVVAPLAVVSALLARRGDPAGALLASGVAVFCLYTYAQVIIGQEYLRLPGNVERFFPLLLAVFLLAEATLVLAWRALPVRLPAPPRRIRRTAGAVLLLVAGFLVVGQHLRPILVAWSDPASLTEYVSSPTPFWMVKLMDLGIVAPVAAATGVGLLRRAAWADRLVYPLLIAYTLLGASVTAMAVIMYARHDPDASPALVGGFAGLTTAVAMLTVTLLRPVLARRPG